MIRGEEIEALLDGKPEAKLTGEECAACQKAAEYFAKSIGSAEESVFSALARQKNLPLSSLLKMTIPGEECWHLVEKLRKSIFDREAEATLVDLFFQSVDAAFRYLNFKAVCREMSSEDMFHAALAFYKSYGYRAFTLDENLYRSVTKGESSAFLPFFESYLSAYRENMKSVMSMGSFGAERNDNAAFREVTYRYIEFILSYTVLDLYFKRINADAYASFAAALTTDVLSDPDAFYRLWLSVNNESMEKAYKEGKYAELLFQMFNINSELTVAAKKVYEKNICDVPVAKESDMRDLYRTVYELQKELEAVKAELREGKGC